jgi:hypothetical protein
MLAAARRRMPTPGAGRSSLVEVHKGASSAWACRRCHAGDRRLCVRARVQPSLHCPREPPNSYSFPAPSTGAPGRSRSLSASPAHVKRPAAARGQRTGAHPATAAARGVGEGAEPPATSVPTRPSSRKMDHRAHSTSGYRSGARMLNASPAPRPWCAWVLLVRSSLIASRHELQARLLSVKRYRRRRDGFIRCGPSESSCGRRSSRGARMPRFSRASVKAAQVHYEPRALS